MKNVPYSRTLSTLFALALMALAAAPTAQAQILAGPQANPLTRLGCSLPGQIRNDKGACLSLEAYFSTGANTLFWVDQKNGNDLATGAKDKPFKTISRAAAALQPGDVAIVRAGTYREAVRPRKGGTGPDNMVTFVAYPGDNVVVSGADVLDPSAWTRVGSAYRQPWTLSLPANTNSPAHDPFPYRRELVILGGRTLKPVRSLSELVPGSFFVEGRPESPKALYVRTFDDSSPARHTVEAARRHMLFAAFDSDCGANPGSVPYLRLIGFTFRHAANGAQRGAVCTSARGNLFEANTVEWTAAIGFKVSGPDHRFIGNTARDNGQSGIGGSCENCLVEYNESSRNNWKGFDLAFSAGGGKWAKTKNTTFRYHLAKDNFGHGIWLDIDDQDNLIEKSFFIGNVSTGIHLELDVVRTTIRNNVIFGSKINPSRDEGGHGIRIHSSSDNDIVHNTIISNEGHGLYIKEENRARDGYNEVYNNLFINNATSIHSVGQRAYEVSVEGADLKHLRSNKFGGNVYSVHHEAGELGNATFYAAYTDELKLPRRLRTNSLEAWQALMEEPKAGIAEVDELVEDVRSPGGWLLSAGSAALGGGIVLPTGVGPVADDLKGSLRPGAGADPGAHQRFVAPVGPVVSAIGEAGSVSLRQSSDQEWHPVRFERLYRSPVVVAPSLSFNGSDPSTVRIRNVGPTGFEVQIDEWDYLDQRHQAETVHFLVIEAGTHQLADGTQIAAGTTRAGSAWTSVGFARGFTAAPVVLSQVVSTTDQRAVVTRQREVTGTGFSVRLQGQELAPEHGEETLAWIAISPGAGRTGGKTWLAGRTGSVATQAWQPISLSGVFPAAPVFVAAMQGTNEVDPASVRWRGLSTGSVQVRVQEEQSLDAEMEHAAEVVGYVAFEAGLITTGGTAGTSSSASKAELALTGESGVEVAAGVPTEFALQGNYPNPFNPATTIRYALPEAVHVQVEVFDVSGRRVGVLVDQVQGAGHHEVAFQAGSLPSGVYLYRLQAGTFEQMAKMVLIK